jgi:hypothetical protein
VKLSPDPTPLAVSTTETPAVRAGSRAAASLQMLGGDEIIQLSIRPSPWCIAIYSAKLVLAMALLAATVVIATRSSPSLAGFACLLAILLITAGGILLATLHWASQLYLLTNRRIMRFRGIFSVDVSQCELSQIAEVRRLAAWYHPLFGLGSLYMCPLSGDRPAIRWEHVARPAEIHAIVEQAVARARPR